jgi:hypothetical protein
MHDSHLALYSNYEGADCLTHIGREGPVDTAGAMRHLDRLAAAALREAARKKHRLVERVVVARVIEADGRDRAAA